MQLGMDDQLVMKQLQYLDICYFFQDAVQYKKIDITLVIIVNTSVIAWMVWNAFMKMLHVWRDVKMVGQVQVVSSVSNSIFS